MAGAKDEDKGEGLIKSRQAGIPGRRCHGVALAKTVKKSFGNEKEKVERWTGRRRRGGGRGGGEKHQQATRGSNLPERRDFASEAGANC